MLGRLLAVATVLALVAAAPAVAQDGDAAPAALSGDLVVDSDLRVEPGETLVLGPATRAHGAGRILVYGNLEARGTEAEPVTFQVPVYVFSSDLTTFDHAVFDVERGFAVLQSGGLVRVRDSAFRGGPASTFAIHLLPTASASLTVENASFTGFGGPALNLHGPGVVDVRRSAFDGNAFGVHATLDGADPFLVRIADSAFRSNELHARVEMRPAGESASSFEITRSVLQGATASPASAPDGRAGLTVIETSGSVEARAPFAIMSSENRYVENPTGVHVESRRATPGFVFTSVGDRFESNGIGLFADGVGATVRDAVFAANSEWDVSVPFATDAQAPLVSLENSAYDAAKIRVAPGAGAVDAGGEILRNVGLATGAVGLVGLGAVLWSDASRAFLARAVFAPLYARLRPGDVLANPARRMILEYVTANPGAHMRRIGHMLGISYGTLAYHLYRLEKDKYVTSREEGLFKRYYPATGGVKAASEKGLMPTALRSVEREILNAIIATPGKAQSAIAADLGVSRQSLHYHIKKLEAQGFITKVPRGRETLVFARDEAIEATRAADAAARPAEAAQEPGEPHAPAEDAKTETTP